MPGLALNTFSDPYIRFAFLAGAVAIGLTLLLVVLIIGLRLRMRATVDEEAAFVARWRPVMLEVISEGTPKVPKRLRPGEHIYFLKLWNYLQESLRGPASERLNKLARKVGGDVMARRLLSKGNRAERLLATLTLGHLRDEASWDALAAQTSQSDSLASVHAARALLKINPLKGTELLLPLILSRKDWDITQIAHFLAEAKQAFWLVLSKRITTISRTHWTRALQLADALNLQIPLASMQYMLLNCRSPDILATAVHSAGDQELLPVIRQFMAHGDGRVRAEVAVFLGRFGDEDDSLRLQVMLEDDEWWVRYRAAQALAGSPLFGVDRLAALRGQTSEPAITSILDHVLAEFQTPTLATT